MDGITYTPDMVLGPARKGIKLTYTTDTRPVKAISDHAAESDLFICEGMYGEQDKEQKAKAYKHMTFQEAATLAKEAQVREMWLTHYSPSLVRPEEALEEAAKIFPNTIAARDRQHIEGHISANYIENLDLEPPFLCLVVSGGHTHLVVVKDYGEFEILGRTRDDAAGEAFDKVARAIGLGYPGGPKIDKLSKQGNAYAMDFPKAKVADAPYDFSFSGVKSAVLNHLNKCKMMGEPVVEADIAASFQRCVVEVLVEHAIAAARDYHISKLAIAGGVASNQTLRNAMEQACEKNGIQFYHPSPIFCTDNAAMIGVAGYYEYIKGTRHGWDLNAVPNLKLGER